MLDKSPYVWNQFNGLWHRGTNLADPGVQRIEEIPEGYNQSCHNIIFSNRGIQNRPAFIHNTGPLTPDMYVIWPIFGGTLILHTNGDLYFHNTLIIAGYSVVISGGLDIDIQVLALPGNLFSGQPTKYLVSGTNASLIVFDSLAVSQRNAAGLPPVGAPTAATGAAGRVELGLHLIAVVFETDSGFITKWGPAAQYTSPGSVQVNLTAIPVGPAGTIARHIVATKVIRNFNGDTNAYEYFFVPSGTINDNVTTVLTINFYDTELVSSADYLLDIRSSLSGYRILGTFSNRAIYATSGSVPSSSLVVSEVANFETVNLVDNVLNVDKVITAWEYDGALFASTPNGVFGFRDNGGPANTWERYLVDSDVICLGTASVSKSQNGTTALVKGSVPVVCKDGIYAFTGRFDIPLTYPIEGLYEKYVLDSASQDNIRIQVDTTSKSFIVTGFSSVTAPVQGQIMFYCDYNNGLDNRSVRWSTWRLPFTIYVCPPIISHNSGFVLGSGKNIYSLAVSNLGTNRDEDKTSGVIVKSAISGFSSSRLLMASYDYITTHISDLVATVRLDNNQPNTQNGFYAGLARAQELRNYTLTQGDTLTIPFNFNKSFERDYLIWGFSTEESPAGYKAIELIQLVAYWVVKAETKVKK